MVSNGRYRTVLRVSIFVVFDLPCAVNLDLFLRRIFIQMSKCENMFSVILKNFQVIS